MLPESEKTFEKLKVENKDNLIYKFPLSSFLCFFTYAFLLLIEKIIFNTSFIVPKDLNEFQGIPEFDKLEANYNIKKEAAEEEEEIIKNTISTKGKFASFLQIRNSKNFLIFLILLKNY